MWIQSIRVEGGILAEFEQSFTPELNVIIGGRGTGKSSVIELIRFCVGAASYTDAGQQEAMEHALGVLGDGRVTVTVADGKQRYEISRTAQDPVGDGETLSVQPFVFSQSEIESIGLQARSRLRLIDGFWRGQERIPVDQAALTSRIRSITLEIHSLLSEIDEIAEKTSDLGKLEAQLMIVRAHGASQTNVHKEIQINRAALEALTPDLAAARVRSELIGRAASGVSAWTEEFEDLLIRLPRIESWPIQAGSVDEFAEIRKRQTQAVLRLRGGLDDLRNIGAELERKGGIAASQAAGFEGRARDLRQKIEEKQKGASAVDKRISDMTQQITVLKSLVEVRKQRDIRIKQLTEQRDKLLKQLEAARGGRTAERLKVAQMLSKQLQPFIKVNVVGYSQYGEYVSALAAALRGSGLRYNELSERIAETFSPQEIVNLAERRDVAAIASGLAISEERALRISDALRGEAGAPLLTTNIDDDVNIELLDGADYKSIGFVSTGQRCTAILPIILRHTERIIALDQPEDHLDNAFVVGTLVNSIIQRSKSAQTIVATHNANIPVLGNATRVVHMDSDGSRCFARAAGSIDDADVVDAITTIMEGGREAFMKRAEFYAKHSPNVPRRR